MELLGAHIVITGGASGIGRAMAERFAVERARGIVVADLDAAEAQRVAADLPDAIGLGIDVGDPDQVRELITVARNQFGSIDLFCANAGVGVGLGPEEPESVWDLAWHVNVMHHVYAARELLPDWLERGEGYFLSTASAAGLLTQIGSAPYSVTKHAAVAFAEWLSITYGDRGVRVSCLCPQGVNTNMLSGGVSNAATDTVRATGVVLEPDFVADHVVAGLRDERFLILPHPEVSTYAQRRASDPDRWLASMRKLHARITGR
jgi:NAD(P)-dependent dehydrogenase (short-subunit alcohol dehydrogenase family)